MRLIVTAVDKTEHRALPDAGGNAPDRWMIHLVAVDQAGELIVWGDISTEDPALAARYALGSSWTLTPS